MNSGEADSLIVKAQFGHANHASWKNSAS